MTYFVVRPRMVVKVTIVADATNVHNVQSPFDWNSFPSCFHRDGICDGFKSYEHRHEYLGLPENRVPHSSAFH